LEQLGIRAGLVAIGGLALAGASIIGISDNPPGIGLTYGAILCLIAAAVWRWRRPRSFLLLFAFSVVAFGVFVVAHNLFYGIGKSVDEAWIELLMEGLHVGAFLIAVLICPAGALVGLVGWIATVIRSWRKPDVPTG